MNKRNALQKRRWQAMFFALLMSVSFFVPFYAAPQKTPVQKPSSFSAYLRQSYDDTKNSIKRVIKGMSKVTIGCLAVLGMVGIAFLSMPRRVVDEEGSGCGAPFDGDEELMRSFWGDELDGDPFRVNVVDKEEEQKIGVGGLVLPEELRAREERVRELAVQQEEKRAAARERAEQEERRVLQARQQEEDKKGLARLAEQDYKEIAAQIGKSCDSVLAPQFMDHILGISEFEFRKKYGWDEEKRRLTAAGETIEAFELWKQIFISEYAGRAAIFEGRYNCCTVAQLDTQLGKKSLRMSGGGGRRPGTFTVLIHDFASPQATEVSYLQTLACNQGAAFQLASTFDGPLEGGMSSPGAFLGGMLSAAAQGELASVGCAAATLYRKYIMPTLHYLQKRGSYFYLLQEFDRKDKEPSVKDMGIFVHDNIRVTGFFNALNTMSTNQRGSRFIPLQEGPKITHILNAAVNVSNYYFSGTGVVPKPEVDRAKMVLRGMYEGAIKAGCLFGNKKLYLTILGGGAFRNDIEWVAEALDNREMIDLIKDSGIEVIFIYRPDRNGRDKPVRIASRDKLFLQQMRVLEKKINGELEGDASTMERDAMFRNYCESLDKIYSDIRAKGAR